MYILFSPVYAFSFCLICAIFTALCVALSLTKIISVLFLCVGVLAAHKMNICGAFVEEVNVAIEKQIGSAFANFKIFRSKTYLRVLLHGFSSLGIFFVICVFLNKYKLVFDFASVLIGYCFYVDYLCIVLGVSKKNKKKIKEFRGK